MTTYKQPTKNKVRSKVLTEAIRMLTENREETAAISGNHVRSVLKKLSESVVPNDRLFADACAEEDILSWEEFRSTHVGTRSPADLTVAYLAGPEPSNDISVLIELGVRPENIWAFENDKKTFALALKNVEEFSLRGIKLIGISLSESTSFISMRARLCLTKSREQDDSSRAFSVTQHWPHSAFSSRTLRNRI